MHNRTREDECRFVNAHPAFANQGCPNREATRHQGHEQLPSILREISKRASMSSVRRFRKKRPEKPDETLPSALGLRASSEEQSCRYPVPGHQAPHSTSMALNGASRLRRVDNQQTTIPLQRSRPTDEQKNRIQKEPPRDTGRDAPLGTGAASKFRGTLAQIPRSGPSGARFDQHGSQWRVPSVSCGNPTYNDASSLGRPKTSNQRGHMASESRATSEHPPRILL